jgi:hypothetical protein
MKNSIAYSLRTSGVNTCPALIAPYLGSRPSALPQTSPTFSNLTTTLTEVATDSELRPSSIGLGDDGVSHPQIAAYAPFDSDCQSSCPPRYRYTTRESKSLQCGSLLPHRTSAVQLHPTRSLNLLAWPYLPPNRSLCASAAP